MNLEISGIFLCLLARAGWTHFGSPTFGFWIRCALFFGSAKKLDAGIGCLKMGFGGFPNVRTGGAGGGAAPYPKHVPSRYLRGEK